MSLTLMEYKVDLGHVASAYGEETKNRAVSEKTRDNGDGSTLCHLAAAG